MQLLKLEVRNWVHHRHRVCEFTRGLVAILGENGSGKSSLFGAIRWALTGENPNFGVKTDNISQYAKEGEPANVTLEFEHNGHVAVVRRHLLPEKEQSTLVVDGTEVARGDKAVTSGIEKILGVDAKFISRFIIVGQTEIFSFIDDNQTETDKFFQRLFNTAKADKCQEVVGKNLGKLVIPEIVQTTDQLAAQGKELTDKLQKLTAQIDLLPSFESFLAEQKLAQDTLSAWQRQQRAQTELETLQGQIDDYSARLLAATAEQKEHADNYAALVNVTAEQEDSQARARTALGRWHSYKSVETARQELQANWDELNAQRLQNSANQPLKVDDSAIAKVAAEVADIKKQLKDAENFVATFTAAGVAHCPTCHTPTTDLQPQLENTQNVIIPDLSAQLVNQEAAAKALADQVARRIDWERKDSTLAARAKQLEDAAAKLVAVAPPDVSETELQRTVNDYAEFQRVKKEIEPILRKANEKVAAISAAKTELDQRQKTLQAEIADNKIAVEQANAAEKQLEQLQAKYSARQTLTQQKTELDFELRRVREQYAEVRQQEITASRLRDWVNVADRVRAALKNAPRIVAQRNLQKLETAINELLELFAVNFVIRVPSDGAPAFIAEFFDGRKQVAQRLSIGQKTVLALAFRVAVNAMFAEEIGLLALDEPTAALDAARIRALAPVLDKLRTLSTAKGLQCLLVTHASSMAHLFESAIELEPPEMRHGQSRRVVD